MFLLLEQPEKITSKLDERVMPMDNLYKKLNTKLQTTASVYFTSKNSDGGKSKSKSKSKSKKKSKSKSKKKRKSKSKKEKKMKSKKEK